MKYGQRVKVKFKYMRREVYQKDYYGDKKEWKRVKFERTCIFLGYRTLSNGTRHYDSYAGYDYTPTKHFKAALVSPSERENPVYVPLDDES